MTSHLRRTCSIRYRVNHSYLGDTFNLVLEVRAIIRDYPSMKPSS